LTCPSPGESWRGGNFKKLKILKFLDGILGCGWDNAFGVVLGVVIWGKPQVSCGGVGGVVGVVDKFPISEYTNLWVHVFLSQLEETGEILKTCLLSEYDCCALMNERRTTDGRPICQSMIIVM
jgi:hypothetical protein